MSNIFVNVVLQQLADCLSQNNFLCTSQSAFRPHYGTETLFLKTEKYVFLSLEKRHASLLTLLDLSAAIKTIDYNILQDRLNYLCEISGKCLSWNRSYLSNRRQSVAIGSHISPTKELHNIVPQGYVLGPISFVPCIQPLSNLIKGHSSSAQLFADDIQIKTSIPTHHNHNAISSVETYISDVKNCMIEYKLRLNDEK